MKIFRMRQKLHMQGLILHQLPQGFRVENGSVKYYFEKDFPNLAAVDKWYKETYTNRLSDTEADEFDADWAKFVEKENGETDDTGSDTVCK
ncbi:MAG: hypothetical protein ACXABY_14760 [Candidatus Thorarchaeota archaeon]